MSDWFEIWLPQAFAALSVVLMGACGVQLLARLTSVLRAKECVSGLANPLRRRRGLRAPGREILAAMALALLSRAMVYALAWAMSRAAGAQEGLVQSLHTVWERWDARHYVGIALEGYTNVGDERLRLVFFPLYPLLMRLLSPLTGGDVLLCGLLISTLCSAGAAGLLYAMAYPYGGRRTAVLAELYFLLSPMSVFLCCAYTEALFILLTLGTIVLLRRGHPWLAALCGMLSALTRMPGVIVAGLFIIEAIERLARRELTARRAAAYLAQVAIVFGGLFLYWGLNALVTGDPMTYLTYQRENWYQEAGSFWASTANTAMYVLTVFGERDWLFTWVFQLVCMFYVYGLLAFGQKKLPFDLAAYSFVYVAVVLSPTWLLSGARYLYALAPLPLLQARMHGRGRMHALALSLHAALLLVWIYGYAVLVLVL